MLFRVGSESGLFGGASAAISPRALPGTQAQIAKNLNLEHGTLRPYRAPKDVATLSRAGALKTIWRARRDLSDESLYWLHWGEDVDVVRSPGASGNNERIYFTGSGVPKVTDATLIASGGGTDYPEVARPIGVAAPATKPTATVSGEAGPSETPVSRYLVYTFVNSWGEEGPPSPVSDEIVATASQTINVGSLVVPAGDWTYSAKRIYMSEGTVGNASFYLVAEVLPAATTASFTAAVAAGSIGGVDFGSTLGEQLITTFFDPPPATMHSLNILPGGVMVGLDGDSVVYSEPGYPYAWPADYREPLEDRPVGIGVFDANHVILTDGMPLLCQGTVPGSITRRRIEEVQACVSKRSIVSIGAGVGYASPDGFQLVTLQGVQNLTVDVFTRDQWQSLKPETMHAYWWDGRIVIFHAAGAIMLIPGVPGYVSLDVEAAGAYVDPTLDALFLLQGHKVVKFDAAEELLEFTWRSKVISLPRPGNFSVMQIMGRNLDLSVKVAADGVDVDTWPITAPGLHPMPGGFLAREFELEVSGTGEVDSIELAQDVAELAGI